VIIKTILPERASFAAGADAVFSNSAKACPFTIALLYQNVITTNSASICSTIQRRGVFFMKHPEGAIIRQTLFSGIINNGNDLRKYGTLPVMKPSQHHAKGSHELI
jgi:hypothetical protein